MQTDKIQNDPVNVPLLIEQLKSGSVENAKFHVIELAKKVDIARKVYVYYTPSWKKLAEAPLLDGQQLYEIAECFLCLAKNSSDKATALKHLNTTLNALSLAKGASLKVPTHLSNHIEKEIERALGKSE